MRTSLAGDHVVERFFLSRCVIVADYSILFFFGWESVTAFALERLSLGIKMKRWENWNLVTTAYNPWCIFTILARETAAQQ